MKQPWKILAVLLVAILATALCAFTGCPPAGDIKPEIAARDAIAAAKGFIEAQQDLHLAECQAEPARPVCLAINKAVAAQNVAVDALEIYCASPQFATGRAPCVPDKSVEPKLREALTSMEDVIVQLRVLTGDARSGPPAGRNAVLQAGMVPSGGFLAILNFVLISLTGLLTSLGANPVYSGIAESLRRAIAELEDARDEVLTRDQLEELRTKPKW